VLFATTFLIHLSGRRGRASFAAAERLLVSNPAAPLYTSRVGGGEFAEGGSTPAEVEAVLHRFAVIEIDQRLAWTPSRLSRQLRRSGRQIGDNETWIAGTALAFGLTIVTRNKRHFGRVPELTVAAY
jgi:predicted nucleic acid-binding protein